MDVQNGSRRVFNRLGGGGGGGGAPSVDRSQQVCYHWRAGRCTRNPCQFRHSELPQSSSSSSNNNTNNGVRSKRSHTIPPDDGSSSGSYRFAQRKPNPRQLPPNKWTRGQVGVSGGGGGHKAPQKSLDKVCSYWMADKCSYGDGCKFRHQWFISDSFTFLTQLAGHEEIISGIVFPLGADKLFSGSKDKSVRVWDCQTGQCAGVITLEGEIGCMISEGPWIFVGLPNVVKAWNTQTNTDLSLNGPNGQVFSMAVGNEMLLAGTQDGSILAWRATAAASGFEPAASLTGHKSAVVSLVVGANRLYSGSMDNTIRVWDLETLQCIQILTEHTSVVMSVLCWEQFLISCSLDQTIKVWVATESGNLEVTYTHKEEHGVLTLCGMHDEQTKPVLLCACNDNTVRLYDLPSFNERGKIFAKEEIREIQIGPGGIFFTGHASGDLKVWKWSETIKA